MRTDLKLIMQVAWNAYRYHVKFTGVYYRKPFAYFLKWAWINVKNGYFKVRSASEVAERVARLEQSIEDAKYLPQHMSMAIVVSDYRERIQHVQWSLIEDV